jgi:hypothetical protein
MRRNFAGIVIQSKGFQFDYANVGKIDAPMIVVFDEAALSVAQY